MAYTRDNNNNRLSILGNINRKRCFLTLLLINCLLGCIYYIHQQQPVDNESTTNLRQFQLNQQSKTTKSHSKIRNAIHIMRELFEADYIPDDLRIFYTQVEDELALGLRCSRTKKKVEPKVKTTTISPFNSTHGNETNSNSSSYTSTTVSSTSSTSISTRRPYVRQYLYKFTLNSSIDACSDESIDLLIMIVSKSENYKTRDAIRRTWGSGKNLGRYSHIRFKLLFLLDFDEKLGYNIQLENNLFHDIVQVELPQQYTLVTHRVLALFEWSLRFCRQAKFVFKTDDDIFVNIVLLLKFLDPLLDKPMNNSFRPSELTIYGYKHYNPHVFREANDPVSERYVVTIDEFPCNNYPDFLSGFGYLISKKARDALVYASYYDRDPFRISDVYITGILPDYLSIARQPFADYQIRFSGNCDNFFDNPKNAFACAAGQHYGDSKDVFIKFNRFWQRTRKEV